MNISEKAPATNAMRVETLLKVREKIMQMKQDQLDALKKQGYEWLKSAGKNKKLETQMLSTIMDIKQGIDKAYGAVFVTIEQQVKILGGAVPKDYKIVHVFRGTKNG